MQLIKSNPVQIFPGLDSTIIFWINPAPFLLWCEMTDLNGELGKVKEIWINSRAVPSCRWMHQAPWTRDQVHQSTSDQP